MVYDYERKQLISLSAWNQIKLLRLESYLRVVVSHVCIECVIGIFSLLEKDILKITRTISARQTPQCSVQYKLKLVGLNLYSVKRLAKSNTNQSFRTCIFWHKKQTEIFTFAWGVVYLNLWLPKMRKDLLLYNHINKMNSLNSIVFSEIQNYFKVTLNSCTKRLAKIN